MIEYRDAKIDDFNQVVEIENSCFKEPYKVDDLMYEFTKNPVNKIIVAVSDKKIVGFIDFLITFNSSTIMQIAVREEYRRKGIATRLLEEMEKTLFQILEGEQASLISEKLNPNFSETGTVEKVVISMTDNSVVCYDMETKSYQNISFSVAEDGDINVGEATPVSAMFSTEEDMTEITNLKTLGSFEQLSADIEKYKADIESLTSEKTAFEADKVTMQEQITALEAAKARING